MEVSLNIRPNQEFLNRFPVGAFLQSRFWSRVLTLQGIKNWQLNVVRHQEVVAHCLLYSHKLPFGKSYLYAPKGPLINLSEPTEVKETFALILSQIRDITIATEKRQEIFCRLEPNIAPPPLDIPWQATTNIQPTTTLIIDLEQSTENIFAQFKEKARYNIRVAEKKNLTVEWGHDEKALKQFTTLTKKTSLRHRIKSHESQHYRAILEASGDDGITRIAWITYNNKPIAAHLYIFFGSTVTYLHGAMDYRQRNLMAPYVLHWQAIQQAKQEGFKYYDMWGLAPADGSKPSWEGFSRFKRGFGGQELVAPGAFDFIYIPTWYNVYSQLRNFKSTVRNLRP